MSQIPISNNLKSVVSFFINLNFVDRIPENSNLPTMKLPTMKV